MSTVVQHSGYDTGLSQGQKMFVAYACMFIALVPLIFYSMPNTMEFFTTLVGDVSVLGVPRAGFYMGLGLGLVLTVAEMISLYLVVWKSKWFFMLTLITAGVSIWAGYVFQNFGSQIADIKKADIQSSAAISKTWEQMILAQDEIIKKRGEQIKDINNQERQFISRDEPIPSWVPRRTREATEAIEKAVAMKRVYSDSLSRAIRGGVKKKQGYGVINTFDEKNTKKYNWMISMFFEILIIVFGFLSILMFDSKVQDAQKGKDAKSKTSVSERGELQLARKDAIPLKTGRKVFAGKGKIQNTELRKKTVAMYLAQCGEVEQGVRDKVNLSEIAHDLGTTRQNVSYHLVKEKLWKRG